MRRVASLVVSDMHLCRGVPNGSRWMAWRQRRFAFDREFLNLVRRRVAEADAAGAEIDLVLNGDVFDFDAPDTRSWPPSGNVAAPRSDDAAADLLASILDDHPIFVDALALVAGRGRLVVVPGNHDAQLSLPATRRVLRDALASSVEIVFRSLCHVSHGNILIEHGHQYDPMSAIPTPHATDTATVAGVSARCAPIVLGCFDPHHVDPTRTSLRDVGRSVARCLVADGGAYAATQMHALRAALAASARRSPGIDIAACVREITSDVGCSTATALRHAALYAAPRPLEWLLESGVSYGEDAAKRQREAAATLARDCGYRGVVMGHTHERFSDWSAENFYGNTGTWRRDATGNLHAAYAWLLAEGDTLRSARVSPWHGGP